MVDTSELFCALRTCLLILANNNKNRICAMTLDKEKGLTFFAIFSLNKYTSLSLKPQKYNIKHVGALEI